MRILSGKTFLFAALLTHAMLLSCNPFERSGTIHIAFVGPRTGESATDGEAVVRGINLYIDAINSDGGIHGRKLVLDVFDDQNDPDKAKNIALQIAREKKSLAVIGHFSNSCSVKGGEVYRQYGIPAITPTSSSVNVTKGNEWYFRTIYNDGFQGRFIANYIHTIFPGQTVSIIYENQDYGSYLAQVFKETTNGFGNASRHSWSFSPDDPKLDQRLQQIISELKSKPDTGVIFLATDVPEGIKLVKLMRDTGIENPVFTPHVFSHKSFPQGFEDYLKEKKNPGYYTDGIYVTVPLLFDVSARNAQKFSAEYLEKYQEEPDWPAVFAYDATEVIVEAMRRAKIGSTVQTVNEDRQRIRDSMAGMTSIDKAVEGASGLVYFDDNGDAPKPISVGVYRHNKLVSAFTQFQIIEKLTEQAIGSAEFAPERVLEIQGKYLSQTNVVYAGARAKEFSEVDLKNSTFQLSFYLWFRYQGDIDVENIEFQNAVEPIQLGTPIDEFVSGEITYRAYEVKGRFKIDYFDTPYGQHALGVSFRHRDLTRRNLIYAVDWTGMVEERDLPPSERFRQARRLLSPSTGWEIKNGWFFQDLAEKHSIGHPNYVSSQNKFIEYSRFNIGITIQPHRLSLRGLIAGKIAQYILGISAFMSLFLLFVRKRNRQRFLKSIWLLQMILAFLILLSLETVLGNWMDEHVKQYYLNFLDRTFDVLWWFIPGLFLSLAVERFLWLPLERRTEQKVPTILRHFVSFTVFLLALFGVVAFVFDQKLTSLLATSGVMAMIIGLAIQINISNIFSGIALNMERPFRIGDWILVHGRTPAPENSIIGCVVDIGWRTTRLRTTDNCLVIIPNSSISEKTVTNFMLPDEVSRFELFFYVDYSVASERVIEVISEGIKAVLGKENNGPLEEPQFKVRVNSTSAIGVEYEARYYIIPREVSPSKARHAINKSVLKHLEKAGIPLAYPKQEIFYEQLSNRRPDSGLEDDKS